MTPKPTPHKNLTTLRHILSDLRNEDNALTMRTYMREQFAFFGIKTPQRRAATKNFLTELTQTVHQAGIDRNFVELCFAQEEREFSYVACDYLRKAPLGTSDIDWLADIVTTKSWWDSVDALAGIIGTYATAKQMQQWAQEENIWLRRVAIIHQLGRKEHTDTALLTFCIEQSLGNTEFFINKAIGWALRDYAKHNPDWVRNFLDTYQEELATLSLREASKYL
ncbi:MULTISPECIES: DNA alkylation repair protein [unclassified Corynebacterium]|uniref:DNA alkylation repair protein n=1 Tax=unclassified Corynebacterium TaxID=2624378 RepID=UPI002103AE5F|nr:DNA alkylation repair protein [Corynebacterium sp. SY003]